jgi:VanZ family protein
MINNHRNFFLPAAIVWAIVIFCLSQIPGVDVPRLVFNTDKLLHAIVYGILGFLTLGSMKTTAEGYRLFQIFLAVVLVVIYGGLDEFHQHFIPGRTADIHDLMADAVGGMLGVGLLYYLIKLRPGKSE